MQCPDCDLSLEPRVVEYSAMGKSVLLVCPNCARISIERPIVGPATAATCAESRVRSSQSDIGIPEVWPLDPMRLLVEFRASEDLPCDGLPQMEADRRPYIYAPVAEIDAIADTDLAAD